jgi:hypothetical protein
VLSCDFEGEVGVDTLALASGFDVGEHCTCCIRERTRIEYARKEVHE